MRTVPLKKISANTVAQAFVHHWVFVYGPPKTVFLDDGRQFIARFFQETCRFIGMRNVYKTTYNPKCKGQVERFNRTIITAPRHYIGNHPRQWDLLTGALNYAYNTQVHSSTSPAPFEMVLSRPPPHLQVQTPDSAESGICTIYRERYHLEGALPHVALLAAKPHGYSRKTNG